MKKMQQSEFLPWLAEQPDWWRKPFNRGRILTRDFFANEAKEFGDNDEQAKQVNAAIAIEAGRA